MEVNKITETIIGSAYDVSNTLGLGFLEKVYENALFIELRTKKFQVEQQKPISVYYRDIIVGQYIADLLVENTVIVELKTARQLDSIHIAQVINYLKATGLSVGLLINFGKGKIDIKRIIN